VTDDDRKAQGHRGSGNEVEDGDETSVSSRNRGSRSPCIPSDARLSITQGLLASAVPCTV
jgi:hypothetical protein